MNGNFFGITNPVYDRGYVKLNIVEVWKLLNILTAVNSCFKLKQQMEV